jgi:hypothetical protein
VLAYLVSLGQYCVLASHEHAQQYWQLFVSESKQVQLHAKLPFVARESPRNLAAPSSVTSCLESPRSRP